ncbi:hypothetical protein [Bradyrhizobium sp. CCBAU 53421]|uniref:hypothetical protein n=1 Tax=Bradyrhizobium sp. CCBAU 53421 TaxID=1325120 RepID=UPI00188B5299|nr:hypothetical protein [Bradyrhizobium sp. CCBAU 53421]
MTEQVKVELDEQELLTLILRHFSWSNADVFAFGKRDSISRLGEIAGYMYMMSDRADRPSPVSVKIVLPPAGGRDPHRMLQEVQEGVRRAYRRFEQDDEITVPFVKDTIDKLEVEHATDFASSSLAQIIGKVARHQAVIVGEAAHYRSELPESSAGPRLQEDIWCTHLHHTMLMAEQAARASGSYILLDIGKHLPYRPSNIELLRSAGDVGLCGQSHSDEFSPESMLAMVNDVYERAAAGGIGQALALIEDNHTVSALTKWTMRLVAFERAGMRDEVHRILESSADTIASLRGGHLLLVARVAADVDNDDLAQHLIERALPDLIAPNELEAALQIARDMHRHELAVKTREQLRTLHPGSQLLRSVDGRDAAQEGNYARAAELLAGSAAPSEQVVGEVFRVLAEGTASPRFADPVALARELAAAMPDFKIDFQREIMRSLERAGRRDEAVAMLFASDIAWDRSRFLMARPLIECSLASGSPAIGPATIIQLIELAASYLADHPDDGHVRTGVADLLDVERLGLSGVALLAMEAIKRTERQPTIYKDRHSAGKPLDDITQLPGIMRRVLTWLTEKADGVIIAGHDAIPADILEADPDAVLAGLLEAVAIHAPDARDPADEQLMRHFVTVALAVAPIANNPDEDLEILRGVAVQAGASGRPQMARDLAEQVLVSAGDRPGRRRKALAAFADIYTRVGRIREALLTLIAASDLPSEGTWHEIWTEQGTLLRALRDLGLADDAIGLIGRLRGMVATVSNAEVYNSRLDTLELHAQLLKHQRRNPDRWPLSQLLRAAADNAALVLNSGDDALPITIMLRQLVDKSHAEGAPAPATTLDLLDRLIATLSAPQRALVQAAARLPDASAIASVAGPLQAARYNDDISYDLRMARTMGRRLARAATACADPAAFAYSLELLAEQGVRIRDAIGEAKAAPKILDEVSSPLDAAIAIAGLGLPVVGMVLDSLGLMVMTVTAAGPSSSLAVAPTVFDPVQFNEWSKLFPYEYREVELSSDKFRAATARLGVPELPERAVLIAGDLSRLPPNVLTVNGDLAGVTKSLATTPSLAWLQRSLARNHQGNGTAAAWIPVAQDASYLDVLSMMVGEIEDVLRDANISLSTNPAPGALASADLAIVGAHGGLAETNRYFRGLSDDQHEPTELRQLIDALRGSRVAILFVCSGGRMDKHPESGGVLGIAHRLLDNGLDAVIAPSWPIPFTMVRPWLDAFLKSWVGSTQIVDACGAANRAVAAATSHDLSRSLAMTLYGNPFITR